MARRVSTTCYTLLTVRSALPASDMRTERVRKSVDRTLAWADLQLKQISQPGPKESSQPEPGESAVGTEDIEERPVKRAAVSAAGAPA